MIDATPKPAHWTGFGGSLKPATAAAAAPRPARLPTPPALMYARRWEPPRCRRGSPLCTEATAYLTLVAGLRQALQAEPDLVPWGQHRLLGPATLVACYEQAVQLRGTATPARRDCRNRPAHAS